MIIDITPEKIFKNMFSQKHVICSSLYKYEIKTRLNFLGSKRGK